MYRKKGRGWTKHIDFMLIDIASIFIAFFISYVIRFGLNNPYMDKDYRILGVAFLLIDFFVEIMADSFKNVLKRGYLDEVISTCKHAVLVFLVTALFLFTTQMADIYSRLSFYIMFPIYVTITYIVRVALKSFLKKKDFGISKKSLFVIAPDAMLRDTLRTVEKSCIGYTKIVAASMDTDLKGKTICGIPIVANHDGIVDYACEEWVDEVLIPPCSEDEYPERMADIFLEMGIAVHTGITKNGTAPWRLQADRKDRRLHSSHIKRELCKHQRTSGKEGHGYSRRTGGLSAHTYHHDICRTGDIYSIARTDILRTGESRQKRKKV